MKQKRCCWGKRRGVGACFDHQYYQCIGYHYLLNIVCKKKNERTAAMTVVKTPMKKSIEFVDESSVIYTVNEGSPVTQLLSTSIGSGGI